MTEQINDKPRYRTSPKVSFALGILSGITLTSLVAFILTFTLFRSALSNTNAENKEGTVVGAQVQANTNTQPSQPTNTAPAAPVDIKITNDDYIRGDKNAKVTLVEYSDFQCPYCSRVKTTLDQLLTDYKGKVRLIFRHFPLTSMHANAQKAAEASECAGEQGKFWEMHDKLFENQSDLSVDNYKKWAKELGLNSSKFDSCLDTGKFADKVKNGVTEGSNYGVQGTPATFVNGVLVSGAVPIEDFKSIIDPLLK